MLDPETEKKADDQFEECVSQGRRVAGFKSRVTVLINSLNDGIASMSDRRDLVSIRDEIEEAKEKCVNAIYDHCTLLHEAGRDNDAIKKENDVTFLEERIMRVYENFERYLNGLTTSGHASVAPDKGLKDLERLPLQKFSGKEDYFYWLSVFDACVHSQRIDDQTKMLRLLSCVVGEPREILQAYPPTGEAYEAARRRLETEYGGKRRLIRQTINKVRSGKLIHGDNLKELREFLSVIESAVINLTKNNLEWELEGGTLFECAKDRLHKALFRRYLRWTAERGVSDSLTYLKDFISEEIGIMCQECERTPATELCSEKKIYEHRVRKSYAAVCKEKGFDAHKQIPECILHSSVDQRHYLDQCPIFQKMDVKSRLKVCVDKKLCRKCLKANHFANNCRSRTQNCGKKGCCGNHHPMLHKENEDSNESEISKSNVMKAWEKRKGCISLQTVPVYVSHEGKRILVNLFLDTGSNSSFINEEIVDLLKIRKGAGMKQVIETINGNKQEVVTHKVELEIENVSGDFRQSISFLTAPNIAGDSRGFDWNLSAYQWPHLQGIDFPRLATERPGHDILIGADHPFLHSSLKEVSDGPNAPVARLTPLGWTALGPADPQSEQPRQLLSCRLSVCETEEEPLEKLVTKAWELDAIGLNHSSTKSLVREDVQTDAVMKQGLRFVDGRYETPLLWKPGCPTLQSNRDMALKRDENLQKSLSKRPEIKKRYEEILETYKAKDYIEKVPHGEIEEKDCWYSPHFAVVKNESGEMKVRIVFDCAATSDGQGLNLQTKSGPRLQLDMVSVILRFRRYLVALIGDIQEMFLQIGLSPEERNYCRFIWAKQDWRWKRQCFGKTDSPFLAIYVVQHHARQNKDQYPSAAETVLYSMYVDDALDSRHSVEDTSTLRQQLSNLFLKAGMTMRKWASNSKEVLQDIPCHLKMSEVKLEEALSSTKSALGLRWNTEEDVLEYRPMSESTNSTSQKCWTKRDILRMIAKIYDPLGFLNPFLIYAKILLQQIWTYGVSWDDPIPGQLSQQWTKWVNELSLLSGIAIPRWLGLSPHGSVELHVFTDASRDAYAAVAYVRTPQAEKISTKFVLSRARVSPLKAHSIPRLELMGAIVGLRMAKFVCEVLGCDIKSVTFWVDSANVLYWLKQPSKHFNAFVSNRCGELQESTDPRQWNFCPTKMNPADLATRGISAKQLADQELWKNGPDFLREIPVKMPLNQIPDEFEPCPTERIKETKCKVLTARNTNEFALHASRWSDWGKLRRRTAYVNRFINNCRKIPEEREKGAECTNYELEVAEKLLIRLAQENFARELADLSQGKPVSKSSPLRKLNPFLDNENIIRAKTRLEKIDWLSADEKYPIILPRNQDSTRLIIKEAHERVGHAVGMNANIAELSKRYWIPRIRQAVRSCSYQCSRCIKQRAKPAEQQMAPIPTFRLSKPLRVFSKVGLDFAGPFYTKAGRGKPRHKRYLLLFTCLQTRAVHFEMTFSMDTDSVLQALSRMVDRRGVPSDILSDNGTSFHRADRELKALFDSLDKDKLAKDTIYGYKGTSGITWHFNPPAAPHFGGVYERMIRSAKRALYAIMRDADIADEELLTAFAGAESLLNSRPITPISTDPNDPSPLTPNHFLVGSVGCSSSLVQGSGSDVSVSPRARWRSVMRILDHFWKRWQRELLPLLQSRQKWFGARLNVEKDSLVLVIDPTLPRGSWKIGRVTELYPGPDGHVRVVDVKIGNCIFRRPITRLCPLEF